MPHGVFCPIPLRQSWFQPFLRFYFCISEEEYELLGEPFQPFLRFYDECGGLPCLTSKTLWFQPFLRFYFEE